MVHDMDRESLRNSLSPMSSGKAHQLEAPTKKGLTDYDKNMTGLAASIQKGVNTLNDLVDKVEQEKVKEQARQERLAKELAKREAKKAKMLAKAREEGNALAGEDLAKGNGGPDAAVEDENSQDGWASDEEDGIWPLLASAKDLMLIKSENVGTLAFGRVQIWLIETEFNSECCNTNLVIVTVMGVTRVTKVIGSFCDIYHKCFYLIVNYVLTARPSSGDFDEHPNITKAMAFSVTSDILGKLKGIYNVVECTKARKEKPDAAHNFRGDENFAADDLFADQTDKVKEWLTKILCGTKDILSLAVQKFQKSPHTDVLEKILSPQVVAAGADWQCCNFSDFMFGRTVVSLHGSTFVAGIPFSFFNVQKSGKSVAMISEELGNMTRSALIENNGFYVFLDMFQGVTIPPGYLYFQCNVGAMDFGDACHTSGGSGCDFLVPCLLSFSNIPLTSELLKPEI